MTNKRDFLNRIVSVSILALLVFLSACKTSTDPDPEPEPPVLPDGEQVMLIEVFDQNQNPLTGYDIDISGPTSTSASNVSESVFTFDDLANGEYTIVVTRDDYVEAEITLDVELPEERTSDITYESSLTLVKKAEPVVINNNEDNEVETAPSDDPEADEDEKTTIRIPANSIPENALDESGNIQIRITRSSPNEIRENEGDGGVATDNFTLEPDGLVLNNDIEMEIPINAISGVTYVLQPGNIPLSAVASKSVGQEATGPLANQRTVSRFTANIGQFRNYRVVATGVRFERQDNRTEPVQVGQDAACGQNGQWTYVMPKIVFGNSNSLPEDVRKGFPHLKIEENVSETYNLSRSNNRPAFTVRAFVQITERNYRWTRPDAGVLEWTRNMGAKFDYIVIECHNSGG